MGSMSLGKTFPTLETFGNGLAAAAKIFKIIDHKPKIDSSSDKGEKPDKINGRLELRNVSFTYPARPEVQVKSKSFVCHIIFDPILHNKILHITLLLIQSPCRK